MDGKYHFTRVVLQAGIQMHGNIVKELVAGIGNCFGAIGLVCSDGTECGKGGVDSSGILEERANDVLYALDLRGRQGHQCVSVHPVYAGILLNGRLCIRGMLG